MQGPDRALELGAAARRPDDQPVRSAVKRLPGTVQGPSAARRPDAVPALDVAVQGPRPSQATSETAAARVVEQMLDAAARRQGAQMHGVTVQSAARVVVTDAVLRPVAELSEVAVKRRPGETVLAAEQVQRGERRPGTCVDGATARSEALPTRLARNAQGSAEAQRLAMRERGAIPTKAVQAQAVQEALRKPDPRNPKAVPRAAANPETEPQARAAADKGMAVAVEAAVRRPRVNAASDNDEVMKSQAAASHAAAWLF